MHLPRPINARLDTEAQAAVARPSRVPTAAEARAYLESLPELWAQTSDAGRKAIAEAVFERIDVLGVSDYSFTLTAAAKARGWDAAFGSGVVRVETDSQSSRANRSDMTSGTDLLSVKEGQSGRGERARPDANRLILRAVPGIPTRVTIVGHRRLRALGERSA